VKIRFLGAHNTETIDTRLSGLLVDGVLAIDAGGLTSSLTLSEQLAIKAVLVTHQHYDHVKDLPLLAMNHYLNRSSFDVYCLAETGEVISKYLMDGKLYPEFLKKDENGKAVINLHYVEPYRQVQIEGYSITPVPVPHGVPAAGYLVSAAAGKSFFYTGDTGPGLSACFERISSNLLITEVTSSDKYLDFCKEKGHLCPSLLKKELLNHLELKGYIPDVVTVHMNKMLEADICRELGKVARELGISISPAYEGKELEI
jgi:ribonuclease BN (tRNA processing enzyme)